MGQDVEGEEKRIFLYETEFPFSENFAGLLQVAVENNYRVQDKTSWIMKIKSQYGSFNFCTK